MLILKRNYVNVNNKRCMNEVFKFCNHNRNEV